VGEVEERRVAARLSRFAAGEDVADDFSREVYCVLGIPVDAIGMSEMLSGIRAAATSRTPFLISTPNLNFLISSQTDAEFRESLLVSDVCPADGIAIVWLARLLGVPVRQRVAGSDMFDALQAESAASPLNVFLFGGDEGVAAAACRALNARPVGLHCVGWLYPGFGSVDDMARDDLIARVNASGADFLVVSLGAGKGQAWLLRNQNRLRIPVRVHLGAVLNFRAGTVKRAPRLVQRLAMEWLWRIKEEPHLWRRYFNDGRVLLRLLFTRVLPLAFLSWRLQSKRRQRGLSVVWVEHDESVVLRLVGEATSPNVQEAIAAFRAAIAARQPVVLDFSGTRSIDARFLGVLLMMNKQLKMMDARPTLVGLSPRLQRLFRLHGVAYLLTCGNVGNASVRTTQPVVARS
jgi:N-acetylglucosaminyldiphosphoundecaprenol N-acetyl-beta-D-mannosaminyltransferase